MKTDLVVPRLLLWGVHDDAKPKRKDASPARFIHAVEKKAKLSLPRPNVEWVPLNWAEGNVNRPPRKIRHWVWVAYVQVGHETNWG
jgi:hypothetical protein